MASGTERPWRIIVSGVGDVMTWTISASDMARAGMDGSRADLGAHELSSD